MPNIKNKIIFVILAIAATISVIQGFSNAMLYSKDFQWSPSVLFWDGINPYTYQLSGNEEKRIILSQAPNYAHLTYVLLLPFSLMNWETAKLLWAVTTFIFALQAVKLISRSAELTINESLIVLFVFLCSTPLRNTIGNGQHAVVVLFCFCALLSKRNCLTNAVIGIGYFKYSFMPPVFLFLAFRRGLKAALVSLAACGIGWIFFSIALKTNPAETLTLPLKVSQIAVGQGTADLMTIAGFFFSDKHAIFYRIAIYLIPIVPCFFLAWYAAKAKGSQLFRLAFISITCLITFTHLSYDFVLLLPAFIYSYKYRQMIAGKLAIATILFNWFGLRIIYPIKISPELLIPLNFSICVCLLILIVKINKQVSN
jgi:hypothetical protein